VAVLSTGERLLVTLWVGALWAIGFMAVPLAFVHFEEASVAGDYAGRLFFVVNVLGLACGIALLLKYIVADKPLMKLSRFWLVLTMLALTSLLLFYLQPEMAAIKTTDWQQNTELKQTFDQLHSFSSQIYLLISLLGLALVVLQDKSVDVTE
jgi:hypothetical protein